MGKLGFYFDQSRCSGCRACQTACKDRNDLPVGELFRHVTTYQSGTYPSATMYHYSATCNHCENPACVAACPVGAMYVDEDTTVQHDDEKCIGCGACVATCPYQVPLIDEDMGVARKCDACKPYRNAGENPVCVDACNMRCLEFGDVDELRERHGEGLVSDLPILPSSDLTSPATLITPKTAALEEEFEEVLL